MAISNKSGIYKIFFSESKSNRFYIGSAVNFRRRYDLHLRYFRNAEHNKKMQDSFNKHGEKSIRFEIIEYCDRKNLIEREQHYLDTLLFAQEYISSNKKDNRFDRLSLNVSPTAGSCLGVKHSEENNKKKSIRQTGKKIKPCSEEKKKLLSKINLGKKLSAVTIERIAKASTGRLHNHDSKKLMSELAVGNQRGNKEVIALNLLNGVFINYPSQLKTSKEFNCDPTTIGRYIKLQVGYKNHLFFYDKSA